MPPDLDIYGISKHRNLETINQFLAHYINRAANENREDEELMIEPLESSSNQLKLDDFDSEPAHTLSHIIQRGLDYPRRSFFIHFKSNQPKITGVTLGFTKSVFHKWQAK